MRRYSRIASLHESTQLPYRPASHLRISPACSVDATAKSNRSRRRFLPLFAVSRPPRAPSSVRPRSVIQRATRYYESGRIAECRELLYAECSDDALDIMMMMATGELTDMSTRDSDDGVGAGTT